MSKAEEDQRVAREKAKIDEETKLIEANEEKERQKQQRIIEANERAKQSIQPQNEPIVAVQIPEKDLIEVGAVGMSDAELKKLAELKKMKTKKK